MTDRLNNRSYDGLGFEDFRRLARDPSLSVHQKIGFPDRYREGFEDAILHDVRHKLENLSRPGAVVLDIGPGCAGLPRKLIEDAGRLGQTLLLVDAAEMLAHLPDTPQVQKIEGAFPDCAQTLAPWHGRVDAILCYSVLHYIFVERSFWSFFDAALELLAPGGQMLIGDIPNVSKRKRFFASPTGVAFHQRFTQTDETPTVDFRAVEHARIDDAVIMGLLMRARAQGADAYWLPQAAGLPMANRREDILIIKP